MSEASALQRNANQRRRHRSLLINGFSLHLHVLRLVSRLHAAQEIPEGEAGSQNPQLGRKDLDVF